MQVGLTNNRHDLGVVYYDASCPFCIRAAERFDRVLTRRRLGLVPLQAPGTAESLSVPDEQLLAEMRLRLQDGTVYGGAAAVAEIARYIWWAWPLWLLSRLPGTMGPMQRIYQWIARRRSCAHGSCAVAPRTSLWPTAFLPLMILPLVALLLTPHITRWAFMWSMAFALYAGCKWLTYREARIHGVASSRLRTLGYLFAWPGMDAKAFLHLETRLASPRSSEWIAAVLKTFLGVVLLGLAIFPTLALDPLLRGWLGMVGVIFVLHFGTFHLLSLGWRSLGVNAMPVMRNPLRSNSLAEFWGRRWNTAFHELATRFTFKPLRAMVGSKGATLLAFLASGLIHELVISVPARGGYGLATAYFLLQGLGVASERTRVGQRLGLGHGWRGRCFTIAAAAGPAFWLFPPPFVHNIILPMLDAIAQKGQL